MTTPDGYSLTADAALAAAQRALEGVTAGVQTSTQAFGTAFVEQLEGVVVHPLRR